MKSALITSVALFMLAALPVTVQALEIEDGHELEASMVTLPSTATGPVSVVGHSGSQRTFYSFDQDTRFFIGEAQVGYAEFKRYVDSKRDAAIFLVNVHNKLTVKRIVAQ